ncbi:ATP-binding protein [Chondrinema litorale]|uniref:DNA polymerase III subunit n=1 Tax=Chondrinema litorale TaxID=2994555 RepID=UPI002544CC66|nr:DNA polymerase III subunit delta' [Chondrinema litorale]UZR92668.1 DNA polymerase III subunit delta [Chondrinema litorale]
MQFSDITGLEEIKSALVQSVKNNHIAHAQLFMGKEGNAGLALALAYAQYINCVNKKEEDSCGVCPSCSKFEKMIHPDLHFIFPTSTNKKITKTADAISVNFLKDWRAFLLENQYPTLPDWAAFIGAENKQCNVSKEESRNIIRALSLKAFEADYKVMFIWLPEWMHPSAANAILKILEEPPAKTLFLMVSENPNQLLTTIISRTQIVQVPSFSDAEVSEVLQREYDVEISKAKQIAYLSEGNLNKAIKLSGQVEMAHADFFKQWMRICFRADFSNLLQFSDQFHKMGKEDQKGMISYALNMLRESMLWQFNSEGLIRLDEGDKEFISKFAEVLDQQKLEIMSKEFNNALFYLERNASPKILFTNLSILISKMFKLS